jgi:sulfite exporter TauE/SafE
MTTNFLVGLFLGLAGSLHCIGMCGPLVLLFPLNGTSKMFGLLNSLIYQLGRVFIYVLLGLLFGAVFQIIDLKYFERYFSIGIGIVFFVLWVREVSMKIKTSQNSLHSIILNLFGKVMQSKSYFGMFLGGMMNGLLPCGLVYGALLAAFGTGTTQGSMIFMLGFGLATIPSMILLSFFKNTITINFRQKLSKMLPWWLFILGIWFLLRGLNLGIPFISPKFTGIHGGQSSCCKSINY